MFWALIIKSGQKYEKNVIHPFHVSMACLDTQAADNTEVQVMVLKDNVNYLLCTLRKNKVCQVPLDLHFERGHKVAFYLNGTGCVHLTGYEMCDDISVTEEEERVSKQEVPIEKGKKRKAESLNRGKKEKLAEQEFLFGDDEYENFDFLEDSENDSEGYDDDDDEYTDNYSEEEDEGQDQEKPAKSQKYEKKNVENTQQQKKKYDDKRNKTNEEETKQEQQSKKRKKKVKEENDIMVKKYLDGGVVVENVMYGKGPVATKGKLLKIFYEAYQKIGKKEVLVEKCMHGRGFRFRLYEGKVMKGLSIGISGMKVGGKRRIKIPPAMGYGPKGSPPSIPPNAKLIYYVGLEDVKD